ncbi:DivIVA domain-containing protein [Luteococcus peritonei]|uniref:DivIVA domain-containing protein n=1 Tax=Luteococcus peritonei TaxID=88874 RepID=A0ABW4RYU0_9ACTN
MMWFLAGVVVLILGAAFVAGSGRWGQMPEVVDDRPSRLLAPGPVDAEDLREVRFSVVTRGYSMTQVDELLERLAHQMEAAGMVRPQLQRPLPDSPGTEGGATEAELLR